MPCSSDEIHCFATVTNPATYVALGVKTAANLSQTAYRKAAVAAVEKLAKDVGIPAKLRELGVQSKDLDFLAESALKDACTAGNPQDVTKKKLQDLYKSVL